MLWKVASLMGASSVLFGAFGAHGLQKYQASEKVQRNWATASQYMLIHSGMALLALMKENRRAATLFLMGNLLFSGSIYLLSLRAIRTSQQVEKEKSESALVWKVCGVSTPIGGLMYVGGWMSLALFL